jgi:hypothetical protein
MLALDCAATEYYRDGPMCWTATAMTSDEHIAFLAGLLDAYPIISIEDGCAEDDWDGWAAMTEIHGPALPTGRRRSVRDQSRKAAPGDRGGSAMRFWSRSTRSAP